MKLHNFPMSRTLDEAIRHLLEKHVVADQDALRAMLAKLGHDLTQPTLSRHLKKLSVQKVEGRYQRVEAPHATLPPFRITEAPPNLMVLRTEPGFANALAIKLDHLEIPGLAGTLAGDDTIFIAVQGQRYLASVKAAVQEALG